MRIAVGNDHHGFKQKELMKAQTDYSGVCVEWIDMGSCDEQRVDYPSYAVAVAQAVICSDADCGVLLCATGVGMSIAANRFKGIYAGIVWSEDLARKSKEDDNTNVLVIPSDYIDDSLIIPMLEMWLSAEFKGGRYQKRLDMIDKLG